MGSGSSVLNSERSDGDIYYIPKYTINEGKLESLKALEEAMSRDTKKFDIGCLAYEWYVSPDGKTVHVLQLYKDSASLMKHVKGTFAKYKDWLVECVTFTGLELYGSASDEAKAEAAAAFAEIWNDGEVVYLTRFGGFNRAGRDKMSRERVL
jgi:quinol monooxygenase YgiN